MECSTFTEQHHNYCPIEPQHNPTGATDGFTFAICLTHHKNAMRKHYVAALRRSARTGVLTAAARRSVARYV